MPSFISVSNYPWKPILTLSFGEWDRGTRNDSYPLTGKIYATKDKSISNDENMSRKKREKRLRQRGRETPEGTPNDRDLI